MTDQTSKPATKRLRRMAREPQPQTASPAQSEVRAPGNAAPSKTAQVIALLTRPEGAALDQMVDATGWQPHTTRAALTGLKKKGYEVTSVKADGVRTYRAVCKNETAPADAQLASDAQQ